MQKWQQVAEDTTVDIGKGYLEARDFMLSLCESYTAPVHTTGSAHETFTLVQMRHPYSNARATPSLISLLVSRYRFHSAHRCRTWTTP